MSSNNLANPAAAAVNSSMSAASPTSAAALKSYKEINSLKTELKELQVKYENQKFLLEKAQRSGSAEEARIEQQLQTELATPTASHKVIGGGIKPNASSSSLSVAATTPTSAATGQSSTTNANAAFLQLQHSNYALQSQTQSLQSALMSQSEELDQIKSERVSLNQTILEKDHQIDSLMRELNASKNETDRLKNQQNDSGTLVEKLSSTLSEYESKFETQESKMVAMEVEFKQFKTVQTEKNELEILADKLRQLLLTTSKDSSKRHQDLLNQLQVTRQFLEELKKEYENFSLNSKLEMDMYKKSKGKELLELREKYDALKLSHYEATQETHQEQMEIIENLQSNFLEYRLMVENLFFTEAKNLEEKLVNQMNKYEQEIKYIIRVKDAHFQTMITNKDAKIMNLIEGTDFAKILIAHQMEMESMRKVHENEMELVKEQTANENKKQLLQLKKEIVDKSAEIDKYHTQILTWEKKLEQTLSLLKKQKKLHAMKEESSEKNAKEVQTQLNKAYSQIETLIQSKENLRHRILRLRLQIEGTADDSVPSIIKRLTKETKRLTTDLSMLSFNHKTKSEAYEQLRMAHEKLQDQQKVLEKELAHRSKEYKNLVHTYESFLNKRLRGGVTGAGRQSLYDPAVTKVLNEVSVPFLQALFANRNEFGTMAETLVRAASKNAALMADDHSQPTLVGLRLGPDGQFQPSAADEKDATSSSSNPTSRLSTSDGGLATLHRRDSTRGSIGSMNDLAGSGASHTKRRSVILDGNAFVTTMAPMSPLSPMSDAADVESMQIQQGVSSSSRPDSSASNMNAQPPPPADAATTRLPSASHLSQRNSPSTENAHNEAQQQRHISLNPSKSRASVHSDDGTGAAAATEAEDPQQRRDSVSSQQQGGGGHPPVHPKQQHAPHHPTLPPTMSGEVHGVYEDALRAGGSRSARLHDLLKASTMNLPEGVKREAAPKSIREKDRRAEAERKAALGFDTEPSPPASASDDGKKGKGGGGKKVGRGLKYQRPASLVDLEQQSELVDMDMIRQLERGFQLLQKFKQSSAQFEADAHGRLKRATMDEKPSRGIGAYQRQEVEMRHAGEDPQWNRYVHLEPTGRVGAAVTQDVLDVAAKVYHQSTQQQPQQHQHQQPPSFSASQPLPGASAPFDPSIYAEADIAKEQSKRVEERKQQAVLGLNLSQYVEPQEQLNSMSSIAYEGEESKLYPQHANWASMNTGTSIAASAAAPVNIRRAGGSVAFQALSPQALEQARLTAAPSGSWNYTSTGVGQASDLRLNTLKGGGHESSFQQYEFGGSQTARPAPSKRGGARK